MKKRVAAVLVLVCVAGCEGTPTISADGVRGSQDGGVIFGSGNRSGSDSTGTTTTSTGENTGATTSDDGRGGVIFGSGN
jgi:hypothetical protein